MILNLSSSYYPKIVPTKNLLALKINSNGLLQIGGFIIGAFRRAFFI